MKFAIYTVAHGEEYRQWAAYLADTLRRRGDFQGDFIIFADDEVPTQDAEVRPLKPFWEDMFSPGYVDYLKEHLSCCFARIAIGKALLDEGYEGLFYCDADCLVIRPVQPLFDLMGERMLVSRDKIRIPMGESPYQRGYLTLEERRLDVPSLNAGTFMAPAAVLFDLLPEYERICRHDNYGVLDSVPCQEQAAFNAWCLRNRERWELFPEGRIWGADSLQPSDDAIILHFLVPDRGLLEKTYRGL